MNKLLIAVLALILAGCATLPSNKFMNQIAEMKAADLNAAVAIASNPRNIDSLGQPCVVRIMSAQPLILEVWNAPHPGPLSTIAYFRSINLLGDQLWPAFERDCGPVLMDIRTRMLHLGLLFGH